MAFRLNSTQENIDKLVDMKMLEGKPTKEILAYVTNDLGLSVPRAYQLWNEAKIVIRDITNKTRLEAFEDAVSDLEEQYEQAVKDKNRRLQLDIRKELNKVNGLYKDGNTVNVEVVYKAKWGSQ